MDYQILIDKTYNISSNMIKYLDKELSFKEFLIILYFINNDDRELDAEKIANCFNLNIEDVLNAFNNLISKNIITMKQSKDSNNKIIDIISLDSIYKNILVNLKKSDDKKNEEDIFELIAKEFDRKLSPIDMEIINGWLSIPTPKELIILALKEASYNGVKTLKFMDKKIYEWNKNGFKTKEDIDNHLSNKNDKNDDEIFEYDWLNDDE